MMLLIIQHAKHLTNAQKIVSRHLWPLVSKFGDFSLNLRTIFLFDNINLNHKMRTNKLGAKDEGERPFSSHEMEKSWH